MTNKDMVDVIADHLLQDHIDLMNENRLLRETLDNLMGWFNKTYPDPRGNDTHPHAVAMKVWAKTIRGE